MSDLSEYMQPGAARFGFWSGGVLREPRQCSFAFPEPCLSWGIRTIVERALTAAWFSRSLLPATTACHRLVHSGHAGGIACQGISRPFVRYWPSMCVAQHMSKHVRVG